MLSSLITSPPFDCKSWITPALFAAEASFLNLTITDVSSNPAELSRAGMPMLTVLVVGHDAAADACDVAPEGKCESEHGEE